MTSPKIKKQLQFRDIEPQYIFETTMFDKPQRETDVKGLCKIIEQFVDTGTVTIRTMELGGLNRAWNIARDCYVLGMIDASIVFSSITVEVALNMDKNMQDIRKKQSKNKKGRKKSNWLQLNHETLRKAGKNGLPIEELQDNGESIKKNYPFIKFVERRNKISHGNYDLYSKPMMSGVIFRDFDPVQKIADIPPKEALDQLRKCSNFMTKWIEQTTGLVHHDFLIRDKPRDLTRQISNE